MNKDYYQILGVSETASATEIKKTYRRLAKQFHPDSHPGDKHAENRFKEIAEAYDVLSDPEKRRKYDEFRKYGGAMPGGDFGGFHPGDTKNIRFEWGQPGGVTSGDGDTFGLGDLFSQFFSNRSGRKTQTRSMKGQDIQATLDLPFEVAALGGKQSFAAHYGDKSKSFSVAIKPGIEEGEMFRLRGQGLPNVGGEAGDLILTVHLLPHPLFLREGLNIISKLKLNLAQAMLGTKIQVSTVKGDKIQLKIHAGSQNGERLRLKGMGIKTTDGRCGDHLVEIEIELPERLNDNQRKLLEEFARISKLDY